MTGAGAIGGLSSRIGVDLVHCFFLARPSVSFSLSSYGEVGSCLVEIEIEMSKFYNSRARARWGSGLKVWGVGARRSAASIASDKKVHSKSTAMWPAEDPIHPAPQRAENPQTGELKNLPSPQGGNLRNQTAGVAAMGRQSFVIRDGGRAVVAPGGRLRWRSAPVEEKDPHDLIVRFSVSKTDTRS